MRKIFGIFSILLLIIIFVLAIKILVAGVYLTIENNSKNIINNVSVKYNKDIALFDKISTNTSASKYLGKIGEGAAFEITWDTENQKSKGAKFNVYFSLDTIKDIRIIIENTSIALYEEEKEHKPIEVW